MHELSIALALVEQIEVFAVREGMVSIDFVEVKIGVFSGVDPQALEYVFPLATENTCSQCKSGFRLDSNVCKRKSFVLLCPRAIRFCHY